MNEGRLTTTTNNIGGTSKIANAQYNITATITAG